MGDELAALKSESEAQIAALSEEKRTLESQLATTQEELESLAEQVEQYKGELEAVSGAKSGEIEAEQKKFHEILEESNAKHSRKMEEIKA